MTQISRPFTGDTGQGAAGDAGPYSASQWWDVWKYTMGMYDADAGVLDGSGTVPDFGLTVTQQSPLAAGVTVAPGRALVQGTFYESTANENLSIAPNASGLSRIDSIILRRDASTGVQTVRLAVLQGTPAASPVPPTLTRAGDTYEIAIADVTVASGFATIANSVIVNRRLFSNIANAQYHDNVLNNSGGTLQTGDVVIWDGSADRAVTTTTTRAARVAGVWVGYTENGGYGRILANGVGYVRVTGSLSRTITLMHSNTAKIAQGSILSGLNQGTGSAIFAILLQATTFGVGNGLALCMVDTRYPQGADFGSTQLTNAGNFTTGSATFVDVTNAFCRVGGNQLPFVSFSCAVAHSVPNRIDFDIAVNGVDYGTTDLACADGLIPFRPPAAGNQYGVSWAGFLTGASGWLQGQNNTIQLRVKTAAATATIYNANVAGQDYPILINAINFG